jgi:hypothetical protein
VANRVQIQCASTSEVGFSRPSTSFKQ